MNFHVITLFPEVVDVYAGVSILGRAQKTKSDGAQGENLLSVQSYQLRDFVTNKWGKADERPYGGGPGMVLQAEPFIRAFESIQNNIEASRKLQDSSKKPSKVKSQKLMSRRRLATKVLITAAGGKLLTNAYAKNLSKEDNVVILCGRYEGIDARARKVITSLGGKVEEVSVGPYILTGGELPALTIIDVTARQIPGVLGTFDSLEEGRVASHEIYTRPEVLDWKDKNGKVKKHKVPKVLLSGNHAEMDKWKDKKRSKPL